MDRYTQFIGSLVTLAFLTTVSATRGDDSFGSTTLHGVALPKLQATLVAQVNGMVTEVLVEEGQAVKAHQPLLVIDARIAQVQKEIAKVATEKLATLRRAELDLELATRQFELMNTAHKARAGTDTELLTARIQRDQAQATVNAERQSHQESLQRLALAELELSRHTPQAPFAGRVTRIFAPHGSNATASETNLITIAALQQLEVELYLPVEFMNKLRVGDKQQLLAGAPVDRALTAIVKSVSHVIDPATRSVRCVFTINNADEKLPSGFSVEMPR